MANVERVLYQRLYSVGEYENERIGFEASVDHGEDPMQVLSALKEKADSFMRTSNPSTYGNIAHVSKEEKNESDLDVGKLKSHLTTFKNEKSALSYLETTEFKYSFEAKQFITNHFKK